MSASEHQTYGQLTNGSPVSRIRNRVPAKGSGFGILLESVLQGEVKLTTIQSVVEERERTRRVLFDT